MTATLEETRVRSLEQFEALPVGTVVVVTSNTLGNTRYTKQDSGEWAHTDVDPPRASIRAVHFDTAIVAGTVSVWRDGMDMPLGSVPASPDPDNPRPRLQVGQPVRLTWVRTGVTFDTTVAAMTSYDRRSGADWGVYVSPALPRGFGDLSGSGMVGSSSVRDGEVRVESLGDPPPPDRPRFQVGDWVRVTHVGSGRFYDTTVHRQTTHDTGTGVDVGLFGRDMPPGGWPLSHTATVSAELVRDGVVTVTATPESDDPHTGPAKVGSLIRSSTYPARQYLLLAEDQDTNPGRPWVVLRFDDGAFFSFTRIGPDVLHSGTRQRPEDLACGYDRALRVGLAMQADPHRLPPDPGQAVVPPMPLPVEVVPPDLAEALNDLARRNDDSGLFTILREHGIQAEEEHESSVRVYGSWDGRPDYDEARNIAGLPDEVEINDVNRVEVDWQVMVTVTTRGVRGEYDDCLCGQIDTNDVRRALRNQYPGVDDFSWDYDDVECT